jgi:hypothetical protein
MASALQVIASTSGSLSVLGNLFVIAILATRMHQATLQARVMRRPEHTVLTVVSKKLASALAQTATTERLMLALTLCNLQASIFSAIGVGGTRGSEQLCAAQAWSIQLGYIAAAAYSTALSADLLVHVGLQKPALAARLEPAWHVATWCFAIPISATASDDFGDATLWCWIADSVEQFTHFYYAVICMWVASAIMITKAVHLSYLPGGYMERLRPVSQGPHAHAGAKRGKEDRNSSSSRLQMFGISKADTGEDRLRTKRRIYRQFQIVLAFMFVFAFGLANRILGRNGVESRLAAILHITFVPLWGARCALLLRAAAAHEPLLICRAQLARTARRLTALRVPPPSSPRPMRTPRNPQASSTPSSSRLTTSPS